MPESRNFWKYTLLLFDGKIVCNFFPLDFNPLMICTGFLKYPFGHLFQTEIKIKLSTNWNFFSVITEILLPV